MADLTDRIEAAAAGPAQVSGDAGSVTEQSLADLIAADEYLRTVAADSPASVAPTKPHRGVRFTRLLPPGGA